MSFNFITIFGILIISALAYAQGNITEERDLYKKKCDEGVAASCTALKNLEMKYGSPVLRRQNEKYTKARAKYSKTCDRGEVSGCFSLAVIEENYGNLAEAKMLYHLVCNKGKKYACTKYANLHKKDEPVPEAVAPAQTTEQQPSPTANISTPSGDGMPEVKISLPPKCGKDDCYDQAIIQKNQGNFNEATKLFKQACDAGNSEGCYFSK
jgi:TPR repeat protein